VGTAVFHTIYIVGASTHTNAAALRMNRISMLVFSPRVVANR
jgi:hypothetical protein